MDAPLIAAVLSLMIGAATSADFTSKTLEEACPNGRWDKPDYTPQNGWVCYGNQRSGRAVDPLMGGGGLTIDRPRTTTAEMMPDHKLTPGAIASARSDEVCAVVGGQSYSKRHRVWHDKAGTLIKYGIPPSATAMRFYEDDDLVPVCLGGDNASPSNHWPQRCDSWDHNRCVSGDAARKDELEMLWCRAVCNGLVSLEKAQLFFMEGYWRP